jgi:hypothetical protein
MSAVCSRRVKPEGMEKRRKGIFKRGREYFRAPRDGVLVESIGTDPSPIVVERAMYSDAIEATGERTTWAAGTGALGTCIR